MANEESKLVKYLDNKVEIKGKPPKGEAIAVYVRPGDKVDLQALGLDLETAKFKLVGGDIVLDVPGERSTRLNEGGRRRPEGQGTSTGRAVIDALVDSVVADEDLPTA